MASFEQIHQVSKLPEPVYGVLTGLRGVLGRSKTTILKRDETDFATEQEYLPRIYRTARLQLLALEIRREHVLVRVLDDMFNPEVEAAATRFAEQKSVREVGWLPVQATSFASCYDQSSGALDLGRYQTPAVSGSSETDRMIRLSQSSPGYRGGEQDLAHH